MNQNVLALYDFASKQEFIYRTSKIKEISGASAMLSGVYRKFIKILKSNGITLKYDTDEYDENGEVVGVKSFDINDFEMNNEIDGEVLYDGGGNLMVLYKSHDKYIQANKIISVWLLKNCPTLSMISSCVCCSDYVTRTEDGTILQNFKNARKALYAENTRRKNCYPASDMPAVTPVSQIDPQTFLPVVHKDNVKQLSLSVDRAKKQEVYQKCKQEGRFDGNNLDELEGMAAVIYIDGNSMGEKLKQCEAESYNEGVRKLRSFSYQVNNCFVNLPLAAIESELKGKGYRRVLGGGDEITIICEAKLAWKVVCTYFDVLSKTKIVIEDNNEKKEFLNSSCAGIAIFHAKSPFNIAYDIAEAACESAKTLAHKNNGGNYVDFYYCHSGITKSLEELREIEQSHATGRPYNYAEVKDAFEKYTPLLQAAGRANVKALGNAAQDGKERYRLEARRVNAYLPKPEATEAARGIKTEFSENSADEMKLIYDMSEFYDLWFDKSKNEAVKGENGNERNT
ncbi:MAG: Cas10/Cmr2 second palm domain-containing protein [Ruminococcus sp.]